MNDDKIHRGGRRYVEQDAATDYIAANGAAPDRPDSDVDRTDGVGTGGADEAKEKTGLRPAPVIAGGIAATTAAFLCSFFGVYGTVIGAGAISVLSTVGSELYLRSMRRSREAARRAKAKAAALAEAKSGGRAKGRTVVMRQSAATDTARYGQAAEPTTRRILSNADQPTDYLGVPSHTDATGAASDTTTGGGLLRRRWPVLAATSAVVFGIGMLVLTGFELATGESLNGQGRSTVSAIVGDRDHSGSDSGDVDVDVDDQRDGDAPATQQDGDPADPANPTGEATPTQEEPQPSEEPGSERPDQQQPADEQEQVEEPEPTEVEEPTEATPEQPTAPEPNEATPAP
ncbi:hypothetical protein FHS23_001267 [Prauserella isguenensis]|uniref:Uncharacterized protein n=1 Tax=Prauserella isguenensis TaxID=1470180 RepID=A0A839RYN5_9PSEU|nr:hypothetical protein [Prauserella isguenensis]MBB3050272.1 hypothetical protein [Prauserella isguenensis]